MSPNGRTERNGSHMSHMHAAGPRPRQYGGFIYLPDGGGSVSFGLLTATSRKMAAAIALKGMPAGAKIGRLTDTESMTNYERGYFGMEDDARPAPRTNLFSHRLLDN